MKIKYITFAKNQLQYCKNKGENSSFFNSHIAKKKKKFYTILFLSHRFHRLINRPFLTKLVRKFPFFLKIIILNY